MRGVSVAPLSRYPYAGGMREPSADRTYATPGSLPVSAVLPELLRIARQGQLSERDEPVAAVVPGGGEGGAGGPGKVRRGAPVTALSSRC